MLVAALTLMPALLAIFGPAAFWRALLRSGPQRAVLWGRVAERVVRRPALTLGAGVLLFGALVTGLAGYRTTTETRSGAPSGSDSAAGAAVLAAHFPRATPTELLLLRFRSSGFSVLPDGRPTQGGDDVSLS
jgi:putative drug exporter of the RND superfamily